ncbi:hypothetical protein ANN_04323 [Periplaneta americana]|uniref:Uncharacterized protein n=1 Tax=Periplaneta americana TaxID=6978 RepID=A0ABQ8TA16_PERAM|nr:hypothetical protein ANN_04323 [Periplaneta americana]
MGWACSTYGRIRNAYRVLIGRLGKRPLGRPRRRWEDNIKMDLREVGMIENGLIYLRIGICGNEPPDLSSGNVLGLRQGVLPHDFLDCKVEIVRKGKKPNLAKSKLSKKESSSQVILRARDEPGDNQKECVSGYVAELLLLINSSRIGFQQQGEPLPGHLGDQT